MNTLAEQKKIQSALLQVSQPANVEEHRRAGVLQRHADWKSAIQQVRNLRYGVLPGGV
jgi:hypothetical protein